MMAIGATIDLLLITCQPAASKSWGIDEDSGGVTSRFFSKRAFQGISLLKKLFVGLLNFPKYKKIAM